MKQLFTVTLLVISLITTAQNTATPSNIKGKDIYVMLMNTTPSDFVKTVQLTKDQESKVETFDNRIQTILGNAANSDFDALVTRDGNTFQLMKYKSVKTAANVANYFGKEVYFYSTPTKKYKTIESKEINSADLKKPFYNIAANYSKNDNATYDAVVISGNKAEYIQYK